MLTYVLLFRSIDSSVSDAQSISPWHSHLYCNLSSVRDLVVLSRAGTKGENKFVNLKSTSTYSTIRPWNKMAKTALNSLQLLYI